MSGHVPPALVERVRERLAETGGDPTPERVADALRATGGRLFGDRTVLALVDALHRETVGAGPLEELVRAPGVTDVLVNGAEEVYVDRGRGLELTDVTFVDDAAVRRLAQRLAGVGGRRLDDASPYVDVRMPDGTRMHAVLAPIARPGTLVSLRVPARRSFPLDALVPSGSLLATLRRLVDARLAFLVTGGTGSGKTTLLAALLGAVAPGERVVLVEDASELRPDHPHVVALEARTANAEGAGAVVLRDLVRQALRMRPDRLVVGEVRGAEVVELLAALNTGHEGGCGTLHANSPSDVPARIEALATAAGLARDAVHSQVAAALQVVVHVRRTAEGRRGVAEIAVVRSGDDGVVACVPALVVSPDGVVRRAAAADLLEELLSGRPGER